MSVARRAAEIPETVLAKDRRNRGSSLRSFGAAAAGYDLESRAQAP